MLGPFLPKTELLFDVLMGHNRAFTYRFSERLYQYALGCYTITSDKPFFCRINRSKHTGHHVRMFILPICKSHYTCIELTHKKPCGFFTTPCWVVVLTDTERNEYTGRLDPYNGGTVWVESQGLVDSNRVSLDETLSWFSSFDFVTPSVLAHYLPEIVDESYSPTARILMPVAHSLKNQVLTPSINIVKMLLSLVPETQEPTDIVPVTLAQRLSDVQASLRHASTMHQRAARVSQSRETPAPPTMDAKPLATIHEEASIGQATKPLDAKDMILAWIRAAKTLVGTDPSKYTLRNLMLLTYKFWSKTHSLPPLSTLDPPLLLLGLLTHLNTKLGPHRTKGHELNDVIIDVLQDAALKAESSLMELLVVLTSEVIDIGHVLPTDIQPYLEARNPGPVTDFLKTLVVTPLRPVPKLLEEMTSLTTAQAVVRDLE